MHIRFFTMNFRLQPAAAACAVLAFSLAHAQTTTLDPVVVTATRIETPLFDSLPSVSVITRQQIEQTQAASLADLLQARLGLEFGRNGGPGTVTSFFLRGADSTNTVIMIDGVRAAIDGWGNLTAVDVDPSQIERIEVLRGNASALYGEAAIGGVIQITTRNSADLSGGYGSIGVGSHGAASVDLGYNGHNGALSYHFNAGSKQGSRLSAMDPSVKAYANPDADQSRTQHVNVGLQYAVNTTTKLTAYVRSNSSDVAYDDSQAPSSWSAGTKTSDINTLERTTTSAGIGTKIRVTENWQTSVHFDRTELEQKDWLNSKPVIYNAHVKSQQNAVRWDNTYTNDATIYNAGVETVRLNFNNDNTISNRKADAVYGAVTIYVDALTLQASLRRDHVAADQGATTKGRWNKNSAMVGMGYDLTDSWRLTSSASTGFRAPSPGELSSNAQLQPESHRSVEAGFVHHTDRQEWRVVAFSTRTTNAIASDSNYVNQNIGRTDNRGLETTGHSIFGATQASYSLTLQDPRNSDTKEVLSRRARYYGTLGLTQRWGQTDVGATLHISGKRDNSAYDNVVLAGYATVDLTAEHHLNKTWSVHTKVENLFDERYELASGYNTPRRGVFVTLKYVPQ